MRSNLFENSVVSIKSDKIEKTTDCDSGCINVVRLNGSAVVPSRSNPTDAGYDLYSIEPKVIKPGKRQLVKTGISMSIPVNYVGLIWPRSGLAVKHGIDTMAGVIDSGYRGEICVVLQNHGEDDYVVNTGDRVAQILFQKVECVYFDEVNSLEDSDRGASGFGSSGA